MAKNSEWNRNVGISLYRFESDNTPHFQDSITELFEKNLIYLNDRSQLNDPFDTNPVLIGSIKPTDIHELVKRNTNENRVNRRKKIKNLDELNGYFDRNFNSVFDSYGIKCFSRTMNNILMWSHYANSHRGICIEFKPKPKSPISFNVPVIYSTERPIVERYIISNKGDERINRQATILLRSKAIDWAYEEEQRVIAFEMAKKKILIDPDEINSVTFGVKSSSDLIDFISNLNKSTKKVPLHRLKISQNKFSFEKEKI